MRVCGVVFSSVMVATIKLSLGSESRARYTSVGGRSSLCPQVLGYASEWTSQSFCSEAFLFSLVSLPESHPSDKQNFRTPSYFPVFLPIRENRGHGVADKVPEKIGFIQFPPPHRALRRERACTATEVKHPPEARYTLTCISTCRVPIDSECIGSESL